MKKLMKEEEKLRKRNKKGWERREKTGGGDIGGRRWEKRVQGKRIMDGRGGKT